MNTKPLLLALILMVGSILSGCGGPGINVADSSNNYSALTNQRIHSLESRIERLEEDMNEVPEDTYYRLF